MKRHAWALAAAFGLQFIPASQAADDGIPMDSNPEHSWQQTGWANRVKKHAMPTHSPGYGGYWVGGACVKNGGAPGPVDGTYGRDYFGRLFERKVVLGWCFKDKAKGGAGNYATDKGPVVPNIFAIKLPEAGH
ncbi:MAG: hypothetical protein EXR99_15785 [Gemmataceae bacterium]|nr:hypothetical protein [Gemmataceae bacterium]